MAKRVALSCLLALVVCGISFYLAYFLGLMYNAATGDLNPANAPGLQSALRNIALPVSLTLALIAFFMSFRQLGKRHSSPQIPVQSRSNETR